jgi:transcriptional regulator with XRE-family HTH domain
VSRRIIATNRLRVLRAEKKISQLDLAGLVPISAARFWRIENGYDLPTAEEKRRIAVILGVEEAALGFIPLADDSIAG